MLIDTEVGDPFETAVRGDQAVAVIDHGLMRGRPADTELAGDLGDGVELAADPTAHLPAGAFGQRRTHPDLIGGLRPRPPIAQQFTTAPGALGPDDHDRCSGDREIAHEHPAAAVADTEHPTHPTRRACLVRLDREPPLALMHRLGAHREPGQVEQHRRVRVATTVPHAGGLRICRCRNPQNGRGLRHPGWI